METDHRTAAEYLKQPYGRLVLPDPDGNFAAEILEFPGCIAVGETASEALANLEEVAVDWINAALEQGQNIPEPMENAEFSGRLVLRMAKSLHKKATLYAEREGVSLNQFIVNCIAEQVGMRARPRHQIVTAPAGMPVVNVIFDSLRVAASGGEQMLSSSTATKPSHMTKSPWSQHAGG